MKIFILKDGRKWLVCDARGILAKFTRKAHAESFVKDLEAVHDQKMKEIYKILAKTRKSK